MYVICCLDPSDPPEKPEIIDYDKDYVEISWKPPKNDGGAPIEKYIIEKKEKGSDKWEKVGLKANKASFIIHVDEGLNENSKNIYLLYYFFVKILGC